jgi:hypothetical protein
MNRHYPLPFAVVLVFWISSCNPSAPSEPNTIVLTPSRSLGVDPANKDALFGWIKEFAVDSSGVIYIADKYSHDIRAFLPDGKLLWKSGKAGHGPADVGEIRYLAVSGDRLYSFDTNLWRLVVRDRRTGSVLSTIPTELHNHGALTNGEPMRIAGDTLAMFGSLTDLSEPNPADKRINKVVEQLIRLNVLSGAADTLDVPYRPMPELVFEKDDGTIGRAMIPFAPMQVYVPNPEGGFTTAWGAEYHIAVVDAEGDTVAVLERDVHTLKPSAAAAERAKKDITEQLLYGHAKPNAKVQIPDYYPHILAMSYSQDGRQLWVRRTYYEDGQTYDVFLDDKFRCSIELDPGKYVGISIFLPIRVVNNKVFAYATVPNTDVPLILTYRLDRGDVASCFDVRD